MFGCFLSLDILKNHPLTEHLVIVGGLSGGCRSERDNQHDEFLPKITNPILIKPAEPNYQFTENMWGRGDVKQYMGLQIAGLDTGKVQGE